MGKYIFTNGKIFTGSVNNPFCDSLAVLGKFVLSAGTNEDVMRTTDSSFEVIDLMGKLLVPGFTDSHIHLLDYSLSLSRVYLDDVRSEEEALSKLAEKVEVSRAGDWIIGNGWDKNVWDIPKWPTKESLDRVAPNNPVILYNKDLHSVWVNTLALKRAGLLDATLFVDGGVIERNPDDATPTGIIKENAVRLVTKAISPLDEEGILIALKRGIETLNEKGIVGVHDMNGTNFAEFIKLKQDGDLKVRVLSVIHASKLDEAIDLGFLTGFGDELLKIGPLKLFADGSLGSQTAHVLKAYEDDQNNFGMATMSKEEIHFQVKKAAEAGISSAVHAIGDAANRNILDIYESIKDISEKRKLRHRIEHAQLLHPDDIKRFAELGITASMQPVHILQDIIAAERYWGNRSRWAYPFRSLLGIKTMLAFGSDAPVATIDPMKGIFSAVARRRLDNSPQTGWYSEERLTVEETIRAYTFNPAWLASDEKVRGKLISGRLADIAILSQDIFRIPVIEIPHTVVVATMVGGKFVHRAI